MSKDPSMNQQQPQQYPGAPPPYGMSQNPPPTQHVIVTQPVVMAPLGPQPANTQCPSCHASITTRVQYENSTKTHMIALLLCLVGCCPCALIPYCTDNCKNANHYCASCGAYVGTYRE